MRFLIVLLLAGGCLGVTPGVRAQSLDLAFSEISGMRADVAALLVQGMEGGALPLVTDVLTEWASPSADSTGDMAVPIVVEVAGAQLIDSLEEGDETGHLNLEAYVYALDDSGAVVDHLARAIAIELARFGEAFDTTGVRVVETVDLPAGTYSLCQFFVAGIPPVVVFRRVESRRARLGRNRNTAGSGSRQFLLPERAL
jgi:hypothetical protein